jgi:hypothetical protein
MKLIFVHGRDQQGKNPVDLQLQWESALQEGLGRAGLAPLKDIDVVFPFYGDELDRFVHALGAPLEPGITPKGGSVQEREAAFRAELTLELARNYGIPDSEIALHYDGLPQEKGPLNWRWVQAILRALDKTPIGEVSIECFTRDVYLYLTLTAARKSIDSIVSQAIPAEPAVVVGHSLGTIVAYNVLRSRGADLSVKRYVTVGSPLGVETIKRYLVPPALAMPDGVGSWFNAFDTRDVVALRPLDQNFFAVTPPIRNRPDVDNTTDNRHGIAGYLNDPEVARWIYEAATT